VLFLTIVYHISFSQTNSYCQRKNNEIGKVNKLDGIYINEGKLSEAEKLLKNTLPLIPLKIRLSNQFIRNIGYTQNCNLLYHINELNNNCERMFHYFELERKYFHFYHCGNGIIFRRKTKAERILALAIEQKNKQLERKIRRIIEKLD
jgi:hypothetical protein